MNSQQFPDRVFVLWVEGECFNRPNSVGHAGKTLFMPDGVERVETTLSGEDGPNRIEVSVICNAVNCLACFVDWDLAIDYADYLDGIPWHVASVSTDEALALVQYARGMGWMDGILTHLVVIESREQFACHIQNPVMLGVGHLVP